MYFYTIFNSYVFSKNTNNVTRITLPNGPLVFKKINITSEIGPINLGAVFRDIIEARLGAVVHNYLG